MVMSKLSAFLMVWALGVAVPLSSSADVITFVFKKRKQLARKNSVLGPKVAPVEACPS